MPQLFYPPHAYIPSGSGLPQAGALLYFYATGTSTPKNTYSDFLLSVANTNPVVADANGVWPAIYLADDINYRVTAKTALGALIYTQDDVPGGSNATIPQEFGAKGDGIADDTAGIQAALDTGRPVYFPAGTYNVSSMLSISTQLQRLYGDGLASKIYATSNFNTAQQGVFRYTGGGSNAGPWFENLWFSCDQSVVATTGVRANLIQYPACLFMRGAARFRIINCRIDQFLIGIDMQGTTGGAEISGVDIGSYLLDVVINGSGDTTRFRGFHCIPFDFWTTNQHTIYSDGGHTCIAAGRCDGLNVTDGLFLGTSSAGTGGNCIAINLFPGVGTNFAGTYTGSGFLTGFTTGLIENTGFDTNAQLLMASANSWLNLSNCYFSNVAAANFYAIQHTAGILNISNTYFGVGGSATAQYIYVNNPGGATCLLQISNCRFSGPSPAGVGYTIVYGTGSATTDILLSNCEFAIPNTSGNSVPFVSIVGAGPLLNMTGCRFTPTNIVATTQIAVSIDTDAEHVIANNEFNGWLVAAPTAGTYSTYTKAIISHNGKRGTLNNNNANIRALAGNAGTGTVAAASTVYLGPGGYANAAVSVNTFHIPKAGNIVGFQVKTNAGPGGVTTFIYTVYQNGVATAMTGTLTGAPTVLNVSTNSFAVAIGDRIELQLVTLAGAAATNHTFSILYEPA